jgi:hypothetical protein
MTEREIDTAIDRALRDLMDVDTDAAFRARLTARLHRPARRMLLRPVAALALTAAAVVVAVVWMRPSSPDVPASAPVAAITSPAPATPLQTASAGSHRPAPLSSPQLAVAAKVRRATATPSIPRGAIVAAAVAEIPAGDIDALTTIDPIDVEPISQTPIVASKIVVAPLSPISEMQIAPMDPQTARD